MKLGGRHSEETKRKIAEAHRTSPNRTAFKTGHRPYTVKGVRNGRWKGGIAPINNVIRSSLEYKTWERNVLDRDKTCLKCGAWQVKKLVAHHILNFATHPSLRFELGNGATLCKPCHKAFHLRFSFYNNNQEQLTEFLDRALTSGC